MQSIILLLPFPARVHPPSAGRGSSAGQGRGVVRRSTETPQAYTSSGTAVQPLVVFVAIHHGLDYTWSSDWAWHSPAVRLATPVPNEAEAGRATARTWWRAALMAEKYLLQRSVCASTGLTGLNRVALPIALQTAPHRHPC